MSYTLLRIVPAGVVLWDCHLRRLAPDERAEGALRRFGREAEAGVWAVTLTPGHDLVAARRAGSRLGDGMSVRTRVSPFAGGAGRFPKPRPPCAYDAVRAPGIATLLTSSDGAEIYEACSAAVLGWDGTGLVCAPADRPRVRSVAEEAIRDHLRVREEPLLPGRLPLLLVNAVVGTCSPATPGGAFPGAARQEIEGLFARLTVRPA